jgi:indolepyruvate ferredoxin oxidoreductase
MRVTINEAVGENAAEFVDATGLATELMGDAIFTNPFLMGYAFQKGLIPLSSKSILQAIELNGAAVEKNKTAFDWGRRAAVDLRSVQKAAIPPEAKPESQRLSDTIEDLVARREKYLTAYQNAAYAKRYTDLVARVQKVESEKFAGKKALSAAVARYAFKLMAYKDEYEVARLYTESDFLKRVNDQFEGDFKLTFHLAPPIFNKPDPVTGEPTKTVYGPWMFTAFKLLAGLRGLRGGVFDVFGYSDERKMERQLIEDYFARIDMLLSGVNAENYDTAVDLAALPEFIRGFGHVKDAHVKDVKTREADLLEQFKNPQATKRIPIKAAA